MLLFRLYEKVTKRDVFSVTFCGVQKVTKNTPRAAALWTPGERFKTRAVEFQVKLETFSVLKKFAKVCQCRKHARPCFEPVRKGNF